MKNTILFFAAVLISFGSVAQSKIGTIDADYILSQMPGMAEVNKAMETYGNELQADFEGSVKDYEAKIQAFQEEEAGMTEEQKKSRGNEIMTLENDIKNYRQKASVMLQMKRNELTEPLYQEINTAMQEVITAEGFTQIFHSGANALAFSAEGFDITTKVLEILGVQAAE